MDEQELEQAWDALMEELSGPLGRKPDLQGLLFLIGVQELGQIEKKFKKEEKQDLMHIAVCHLLSKAGYFEFTERDADGWPHYKAIKSLPLDQKGLAPQEQLLKEEILRYFDKIQ